MNVRTTPLWIAGESKESESGEYFDVLNPLDDSLYARAAKATAGDIDLAVTAANESFQTYRRSLPKEREAWLIRAADLLQQQASDFIEVLIDEVGSPLAKAQREVASSVGILRAAAGACRQLSGKTMPTDIAGRMSISIREPLGVIAGITPFNVPLIKGIKHSAMPLATGNTLVMLPSEHAPVTALRIAQLYADAGIPKGAVNIVSGDGYEIGDRLTTHPLVQAVGFTGSCRVGKHVSRLCGEHGKRLTLEMGGKNPLVILRDADLQRAVAASVLGSFFYQGQICMSSSRIYVQQDIYDEYLTKFVAAAKNLAMGDLRDKNTMIGPIISHRQRERVKQHIENAKACGAKLQTGGEWSGNRCQPTIFSDVPANAILTTEETFGPVTAVYSVDSFDDALQQVNDSPFGLSASIFTSDMGSAMKFVDQANAGMVHVNGATVQEEAHVPFGGNGSSGFGRESTDADIQELTRWKWATLQG